MPDEQHIYHHNDGVLKVSMKVERNSRGVNWEVSVSNSSSVDECLAVLEDAEKKLRSKYSTEDNKKGE